MSEVNPPPALRAHPVRSLEDRVRVLQDLYNSSVGGIRDPMMRDLGLQVTRHCPARDTHCELKAIFDFTTKNARYTGDVARKDTFQSPLRTLQYGGGDCDDHSALNAVLAAENGYDTKFRITSNTGKSWDHIYTMAAVPKHAPRGWVVLDTTLGTGRYNRHPPQAKHRDFPLESPDTKKSHIKPIPPVHRGGPTKKLKLPGGGHYAIPMPERGRFIPAPGMSGAPQGGGLSTRAKVALAAGGAVLGGLTLWAIAEILD